MDEVKRFGEVLAQARSAQRKAMEDLAAAVRAEAHRGAAEVDLAREARVNRTTIRKMLGK